MFKGTKIKLTEKGKLLLDTQVDTVVYIGYRNTDELILVKLAGYVPPLL